MNSAKFIASAGAFLLATTALTSAASAQVVYKGRVVTSSAPQVSSTYSGQTIYQPGTYTTGNFQKVVPQQNYVIAAQPAPIPVPIYAAPQTQNIYTETVNQPVYAETVQTPGYGAPVQYSNTIVQQPAQSCCTQYAAPATSEASAAPALAPAVTAVAPVIAEAPLPQDEPVYITEAEIEQMASYDEVEILDDVVIELNDTLYVEDQPTIVVGGNNAFGAPTKENAMRLSVGYGYATAGNFQYGINGNYTSTSADTADWTSTSGASTSNGTPWIDEEIQHKGYYGSLKADAGNFFFDAVGGSYTATDYAITQRYNLAEAAYDNAVLVGPAALTVDGTIGAFSGVYGYNAYSGGDGVMGDEYDSLDVTATINSTINDFGGAAGYLLNMSGVPMKIGFGVAGKSLSRNTTAVLTHTVNEVTTGELASAEFLDHTYTEEVTGLYVGPAIRVNYDPKLNQAIGAHFGGSLQALYGNSDMVATQDYGGSLYEASATDTGMLISGELDAGLSFQAAPNMRLGVGVFAGMTSGAPIVTAALDGAALAAEDRTPTLGRGSWQNYGLKGSISASF